MNTANSIKVDIDNSQMYDLCDKIDGNNHSFTHEDATNIMLNTIFVIPQGHYALASFKTIFPHQSLGVHIADLTIADVNLNSISIFLS